MGGLLREAAERIQEYGFLGVELHGHPLVISIRPSCARCGSYQRRIKGYAQRGHFIRELYSLEWSRIPELTRASSLSQVLANGLEISAHVVFNRTRRRGRLQVREPRITDFGDGSHDLGEIDRPVADVRIVFHMHLADAPFPHPPELLRAFKPVPLALANIQLYSHPRPPHSTPTP